MLLHFLTNSLRYPIFIFFIMCGIKNYHIWFPIPLFRGLLFQQISVLECPRYSIMYHLWIILFRYFRRTAYYEVHTFSVTSTSPTSIVTYYSFHSSLSLFLRGVLSWYYLYHDWRIYIYHNVAQLSCHS